MNRRTFLAASASSALFPWFGLRPLQADVIAPDVQRAIDKGLGWLARTQFKDGHFEGANGQYPVALTALAGMAFLMEGSTIREGKYAENIRRTVDWLLERCQNSGLIGNPSNFQEAQRYTYGHGFATLFLASVYGEEEDGSRRLKLEEILTKAANYIAQAQTSKGGWGYLARGCDREGDDIDEGSTTATQLQALRAVRNVGVVVPKIAIDKARKYLEDSTGPDGHVQYRIHQPGARPALTAAAIACGFSIGEYDAAVVKRWIKAAHKTISPLSGSGGRFGHDEYAHYYFAQAVYTLGDDGYGKLFPGTPPGECLTWSGYKKQNFDTILKGQNEDGSWTGNSPWARIGAVYTTAIYLTILQLDKGVLPIYQR